MGQFQDVSKFPDFRNKQPHFYGIKFWTWIRPTLCMLLLVSLRAGIHPWWFLFHVFILTPSLRARYLELAMNRLPDLQIILKSVVVQMAWWSRAADVCSCLMTLLVSESIVAYRGKWTSNAIALWTFILWVSISIEAANLRVGSFVSNAWPAGAGLYYYMVMIGERNARVACKIFRSCDQFVQRLIAY